MKKLILSVFSFVVLSLIFNNQAEAVSTGKSNVTLKQSILILHGDDFVPIPWGLELPISWKLLSGTWILKQGKLGTQTTSYFTFQLIKNLGGSKMLVIRQIDPKTCMVLGSGVASQSEEKIIYATLRSAVNNQVYRINFRNYSSNLFNSPSVPSYEGHVMLMSIAPINSYEFTHYPLARVTFNFQNKLNCVERLIK